MAIFGEVQAPHGRAPEGLDPSDVRKFLRTGAVVVAVIVAALIFFNYVAAVTRIGAGYVGVEVLLSGSQRGPSEIPIKTGWVFYSPLRSEVIEFPTFVQTVKWTHDPNEGHPVNEEMSYNSKEGMEIYSDVSLSYAIDPKMVPDFYLKYRLSNLDAFTHGILRDVVRNSLNEVASTYPVEDIYGERKTEFLHKVEALIQSKMAPVGVGIQQFGFIGAPRVPDVISSAITGKAQAIQNAERAQNELAQTQAEAAKKIAEADGDAKSEVARAQGEAEANRIRQASITPQLLELRRLENQRALVDKWNGQLPQVESGNASGMMLQLPKPQ
ncbi:regulator of protease activity HflC (stomatin/prohibitin superfamily) [Silvibacterium bohemicum]|uniref:Regulator of protease activity HflC (Stomatin/prohibitin superfamily) n=1 Tax=Silvibacterium bohemicum TaxID=1577686 RepID=A0A841JY58_9BACT|nr:SPFH domain-containing protein [Silvibacterium bohemicum]MBB6146266.1 regulator of protease activity HflC (stomatin/prohibitin superfamily) [Silvibacterium bohemicum]